MQSSPPSFENILELLSAIPKHQAALVILFFAFFIIAGNAVFALHYHRVGKPVLRSLLNPCSFLLQNFNVREWLLLLVVFAVSLGIVIMATISG
jgi:Trk-type K+ transport system membrane component